MQLSERFNIAEIAFDRWNATFLTQRLESEYGFMIMQFRQGIKSMDALIKELEKMVLEKKIAHNGNKILRWNINNIMIRQDSVGNIKIDEAKSTEKVNSAVVLVMILDGAIRNAVNQVSAYNLRGLLFIGGANYE